MEAINLNGDLTIGYTTANIPVPPRAIGMGIQLLSYLPASQCTIQLLHLVKRSTCSYIYDVYMYICIYIIGGVLEDSVTVHIFWSWVGPPIRGQSSQVVSSPFDVYI